MSVRLGKGFSDFVRSEKHHTNVSNDIEQGLKHSVEAPRVIPLFLLFTLLFGILFIRLFWITLIKGSYYKDLADNNRVREEVSWAKRGTIYDRNNIELTSDRPIYRRVNWSKEGGQIFAYFSQEDYIKLEAERKNQDIEEFITRSYPYGKAFAHVIGYVGEVDKMDVKSGKQIGSLIGKSGLEKSYDEKLRGKEGKVLIETNSLGIDQKELDRINPKIGDNLYTSLDLSLQMATSRAMDDKAGAVVITNPSNGEILVLYSNPSYDPNVFINSRDTLIRNSYFEDKSRPLFNRAIGGQYPPGSIFKIISSVAGLESGAIQEDTIFVDNGFIQIGKFIYRNWYFTQYGRTEGDVDIVKAIGRSVDTYFYELGGQTGIEEIVKWANKFGLGKLTGISITGEVEGRMPDPAWKLKTKKDRWYLGDTYITAIGQGDVLTTPIQVNLFTSAIANQGKLCKPQLTRGEPNCTDLKLDQETIDLVVSGMTKACEPGGTGYPFFEYKVKVACKTGTAEFGSNDKTHAWFTVFAPATNPEIAVTVLLEEGGAGSDDAAPIAKQILDGYFKTGF